MEARGPNQAQPAFRNAVDERAWRHQQLARSFQTGGAGSADSDFQLAMQLALEDEAGARPAPGVVGAGRAAVASPAREAPGSGAAAALSSDSDAALATPPGKKNYFSALKQTLRGRRRDSLVVEEPSSGPSLASTSIGEASLRADSRSSTLPRPYNAHEQWGSGAAGPVPYSAQPRGGLDGPAGIQQSAYARPASRGPRVRRLSQYRVPLEHSALAEQPPASPRSLALVESQRRASEVTSASEPTTTAAITAANGRASSVAVQESWVQEDYGSLLQDSHLIRRDIAQAIEDREIQKEDLDRQSSALKQAMGRCSDSRAEKDAYLRHTQRHARIEEDQKLVLHQTGALQQATSELRKMDAFVRSSKPSAAEVTMLQDALIREYLGRLSVLGVILLELPPEVAASYAAPVAVAAGAPLPGPSTATRTKSGLGDSDLRQLLRSDDINMAAALAIIRERQVPQQRQTGGRPVPPNASLQDTRCWSEPRHISRAYAAGSPADPASRRSSGSGTDGQFSFPLPRDQPLSSGHPGIGRTSGVTVAAAAARQASQPLHSVESDAQEAAELLLADLSASDDDGSPLARVAAVRIEPSAPQQCREAELKQQQQDAEKQQCILAAAAAAEATRKHAEAQLAERRRARAEVQRWEEEEQVRVGIALAEERRWEEQHARAEQQARTAAALAADERREEQRAREQAAFIEHQRSEQRRVKEKAVRVEEEAALAEKEAAFAERLEWDKQRAREEAAIIDQQRWEDELQQEEQRAAEVAVLAEEQRQKEQRAREEAARVSEERWEGEQNGREEVGRAHETQVGAQVTAASVAAQHRSDAASAGATEASQQLAAGAVTVAATASEHAFPAQLTAVEEARAAERRKREDRQVALAAQKKDIQVRRQRRLSVQPDLSGFRDPAVAALLKTVLKTQSPRGQSPEPSPPRSPVSIKFVTFAPIPVGEANSISSSSSGSRKAERGSNGSLHRGTQRQETEEAERMRRIEKEFAMMELQALLGRHSPSPGSSSGRRSGRAGTSAGVGSGERSPERASSRALLAASVASEGRCRRATSEGNEMDVHVGVFGGTYEGEPERGRSAQHGGIPAGATLTGSRRSTAPSLSPRQRQRSEFAAAPTLTPRSPQAGAPGRLPPLSPRAERNASVVAGRMPGLQLPPPVQPEARQPATGPEVKAVSAWTAALDAMAMARRKKGSPAPAHLDSVAGVSPAGLTHSHPQNGSSSSRQAATLAANAASDVSRAEQGQQYIQDDAQRIRQLSADIVNFAATDMAKVAAFVRRAKAQLPSDLSESALRQMGWPESKWRVLQASISAWQEIAQMTDAQLAWQILDDFPLSDEAVRLETYYDIVEHSPADLDAAASAEQYQLHGIPWDPQVYAQLRAASLNLAKLYMQSTLNEAAKLPSKPAEEVVGHLFGSVRLTLRVQQFAGGLNSECTALLASVRRRQSSLQR